MLEKSKYLERFRACPEEFELLGDNLLVEKIIPAELKTKGGLVIAHTTNYKMTLSDKKATFVRVLIAGRGYYNDETGEPINLDTRVGDILLVSPESITFYSQLGSLDNYEPETIGLMREGAALCRFRGEEAYERVFSILNRTTS